MIIFVGRYFSNVIKTNDQVELLVRHVNHIETPNSTSLQMFSFVCIIYREYFSMHFERYHWIENERIKVWISLFLLVWHFMYTFASGSRIWNRWLFVRKQSFLTLNRKKIVDSFHRSTYECILRFECIQIPKNHWRRMKKIKK